jgi:hypothetical protein
VPDLEAVLGGTCKVLIDVALRIDNGSRARGLVADEIRRVRETIQVELFQYHRRPSGAEPGPARYD